METPRKILIFLDQVKFYYFFQNVTFIYFHLCERQTNIHKAHIQKEYSSSSSLSNCPQQLGLAQTEASNQESHLGSQDERQYPRDLNHYLLPPRAHEQEARSDARQSELEPVPQYGIWESPNTGFACCTIMATPNLLFDSIFTQSSSKTLVYFYLFEMCDHTEKDGEAESYSKIFHLLIHIPNGCNCQG